MKKIIKSINKQNIHNLVSCLWDVFENNGLTKAMCSFTSFSLEKQELADTSYRILFHSSNNLKVPSRYLVAGCLTGTTSALQISKTVPCHRH